MAIRPDRDYEGAVQDGAKWVTSRKKGTTGLQIFLRCDDGEIDYTIWFTDGRREQLEDEFDALGITPEQRQSAAFLQYQLPAAISGREISFHTKLEEYQGRETVKVGWIGARRLADEGEIVNAVANFFGGAPAESKPAADEDIPF